MSSTPVRAPEFPPDLKWLNTESALSLAALAGKVVLLDFWTGGCINCRHVQPELDRLSEEFSDSLVVVGVHSPKFPNERSLDHLTLAMARQAIRHPVVHDPELYLWNALRVQMWPTMVLIDPAGYVVGMARGEGHYELLRKAIARTIEVYAGLGKLKIASSFAPITPEPEQALRFPGKVLADPGSQHLYVSDSGHHRILISDLLGRPFGQLGTGQAGNRDGAMARACFRNPQGLALIDGSLFVADAGNHQVRRCDLQRGTVETIAGTGEQNRQPGDWRITAATSRALNSPWDLHVQEDLLFIAMAGSHQVWLLDLSTFETGPFAGSGAEGLADGPPARACFAQPSGLTGHQGHLFVADSESSAVRAVPLDPSRPVMTVVGQGLFDFGDRDGAGEQVLLQHPEGLAVHAGRLYLADTYNHKLKMIRTATRECATLAGDGEPGHSHTGAGRLNEPAGLSSCGDKLFIADTNNHLIRSFDLAGGSLATLDFSGF